jgi:hypothetical protein
MDRDRTSRLVVSLTLVLAGAISCVSSEPIDTSNPTGSGGTPGGGTAGTPGGTGGTPGGTAGTPGGTGGTPGGTGGTPGGTGGTPGGTGGTPGGTAGTPGTGGTPGGTAGTPGTGGTPGGTAGTPGTAGMGGSGGAAGGASGALSFKTDILPIINMSCHNCHQTGTDGGLNLKDDANMTAYKSLLGTGTGQATNGNKTCMFPTGTAITTRVVPNDPAHSMMYIKVSNPTAMLTPGKCGNGMPNGQPMISQANITKIHDWIMQGAKP